MPSTTDYLPVAAEGGSNVETQAEFAGSTHQQTGFVAGTAYSAQMNKVWRQSSMVANLITQWIANALGINIVDDGNQATLLSHFLAALSSYTTAGQTTQTLPYAAAVTLDMSTGTAFYIEVTGNITINVENYTGGFPNALRLMVKNDGNFTVTFSGITATPAVASSYNVWDFAIMPDNTFVQTNFVND